MDALKQKSGKLQTLIVLWKDYDVLATYGAYEVLIACPERFQVSTVGGTPRVSTLGAPNCLVDYCCGADDPDDDDGDGKKPKENEIPRPDIVIVPDGDFSIGGQSSTVLETWLEDCTRKHPNTLVVRVGPRAMSEPMLPMALREVPPENILRCISGADLAVDLLAELAGKDARTKAEEMIEYRGRDPFADPPKRPPPVPEKVFRNSIGGSNGTANSIRLGIFIFEGFEMLDTFGPMAAFVAAQMIYEEQHPDAEEPLFQFTFYSERLLVKSSRGPLFRADRLLDAEDGEEDFSNLDWLLIPGGLGTLTENHNPVGQAWTRTAAERAKCVITVCTGSGYLAHMGLLDGRRATTNKLGHDLIASWGPKVRWQPKARWVNDGKFWTSSGVAAGTDQALAILKTTFDSPELADAAAYTMGWHHRVDDGDRDCFVAKRAWRVEVIVTNFLITLLCSWLPQRWRPGPSTIDRYLG